MPTEKIKPYLELPYPITVVMIFLAYLVGLIMGAGFFPLFYVMIGFIAFFGFIGGFNTLNAVYDVESDKISKPYRSIPSGRISTRTAFFYALFLFLVANSIAYVFFEFEYFVFFILMTIVAIFYSVPPAFKKTPVLSDLIITVTYTLFPLIVGWGAYNSLYSIPWAQFSLIFFFGLSALFSKNFEDYEADLKTGTKTLVGLFGLRWALFVDACLYFFSFALVLFFVLQNVLSTFYLAIFIVSPILAYCFSKFYKNTLSKSAFSFFKWLTISLASVELIILWVYLHMRG